MYFSGVFDSKRSSQQICQRGRGKGKTTFYVVCSFKFIIEFYYWVTLKLPQICTVIFRFRIGKVA